MLLDVNFEKAEETAKLTFFCKELNEEKDYSLALAILTTFCGDFALEPELEIEDLQEIAGKANEGEAKSFTFFINEEELEAEIN